MGDVNAGVQLTLKDDRYERPLNTNFYLSKPLVLPASWGNGGKGTCHLGPEGGAYLVRCGSGPRRMEKGETQRYDFRLALTPFKPIRTDDAVEDALLPPLRARSTRSRRRARTSSTSTTRRRSTPGSTTPSCAPRR